MPRGPNMPVKKAFGASQSAQTSLEVTKLLQEGLAFHKQGKLNLARSIYEQVLKKQNNNFLALKFLGVIYNHQKQFDQSLKYFDQAIKINKQDAGLFNNRGIALKELNRLDESLKSFNNAIHVDSKNAVAFNNRGIILKQLKQYDEALKSYENALQNKPDYAEAHNNKGNIFVKLKRFNEAVKSFEKALLINPNYADAFSNQGNALNKLNRFDEALKSHEQALKIKPDCPKMYTNLIYLMQDAAFWDQRLTDLYSVNDNSTHVSLNYLNLFRLQSIPGLSASQVVKIASDHSHKKIKAISPLRQTLGFPPSPVLKDKINLGFLSMDLRDHVVMRLLSGFFESINRDKFRLFAYSYGADDKSELRKKAETSFDVFRDVRTFSDEQVAKQIAEDEVHILIDLAGHTDGNRLEITLLKPAPITIHMTSDPGTLGKGAVDYKIASNVVAMKGMYYEQYAESLILVPPSIAFDTRIVPPAPDTRQAHGLPNEAFVFCSFNQIYKINPPLFDCWMQILREVPDSILWLWADDLGVQSRLKAEAASRGVDQSRLVFAKKAPLSSHYARMQLADLALDTFPYGSHSTGAHALWCGVPLLGFGGETPASRVSASHLAVCGLPELSIEGGYKAYAQAAIDLAKDRPRLASIRQKLINSVREEGEENPFCINHRVKIFEAAMEQVWRRHEQGLPVQTFEVQL